MGEAVLAVDFPEPLLELATVGIVVSVGFGVSVGIAKKKVGVADSVIWDGTGVFDGVSVTVEVADGGSNAAV